MKGIHSRPVPSGVLVAIVALAIVGFGAIGLLRLSRNDGQAIPDSPISVPRFVDPAAVEHGPRFRFFFDPPQALTALRIEEGLDEVVGDATTHEEALRRLMAWTSAQWKQGLPNPYPPPDARVILRDIREGRTGGFCAQYCFVLTQAIQSYGVPARLVTLSGHVVTEAWLEDEERWTVFDPAYDLQLLDGEGRSLNALEVRRAMESGDPPALSAGHHCPLDDETYLGSYRDLGVWTRNDFISRPLNYDDFPRYQVWFDPRPDLPLAADALRTSLEVDLWGEPAIRRPQ